MAVFYLIENDFNECTALGDYQGDYVSIVKTEEIEQMLADGRILKDDIPTYKNATCCRTVIRPNILRASFSIISKDKKLKRSNFGFILRPGHLTFIDDGETVKSIIKKIKKHKSHGGVKIGRFLYEFLETIIEHDLRYMEELHDRIIKMESGIVRGMLIGSNTWVSDFNKEILTFYRFYTQLVDIGLELQENENDFFEPSDIRYFEKFTTRAMRLREETHFLKESANHVCDLFAAQLDSKTNKVMKWLTIVTTIFMPVTVIGTWYGMNFTNMPELTYEYGYLLCFIATAITMAFCWWYLKRKKFF